MSRNRSLFACCLLAVSGALLFCLPAAGNVDADQLLLFIEGLGAPESDLTGDGRSDFRDLLQLALYWQQPEVVATPVPGSPTPTPTPTLAATDTPTPTLVATDTPTPTPTPTNGTAAINFREYFPLGAGDTWHYIGFEGGSVEDNFRWTVQAGGKDVGGGKMAARMKTDTDEASDDRNLDEDYWGVEANGDVIFYGFRNGQADSINTQLGPGTFPVQEIVFSDPLLIGKDGMMVGEVITDTGAAQFLVQPPIGPPQTVSATLSSTVTLTGILPTKNTPLGVFTDVLRVEIEISAVVFSQTIPVRGGTFFLKKHVGMIAQDQQTDPDDAEVQAIDGGTVGGQPVVAH